MRNLHARTRARIAVLTIVSFLASPMAPLVEAQAPAAKPGRATLEAKAKNIRVVVENGGHRPLVQ